MPKRLHTRPSFESKSESNTDSTELVQPKSEEDILKILPSYIYEFVENPSNYSKEEQNTITRQLIENGYSGLVANNLYRYRGLDESIAYLLIAKHKPISVLENIAVFETINFNRLAEALIELGVGELIFTQTGVFQPHSLDAEIAIKLIESGK